MTNNINNHFTLIILTGNIKWNVKNNRTMNKSTKRKIKREIIFLL